MNKIAIVIPAYNEDKNIIKLVKEIRKITKSIIVVVDDSQNLKTKKINTTNLTTQSARINSEKMLKSLSPIEPAKVTASTT